MYILKKNQGCYRKINLRVVMKTSIFYYRFQLEVIVAGIKPNIGIKYKNLYNILGFCLILYYKI